MRLRAEADMKNVTLVCNRSQSRQLYLFLRGEKNMSRTRMIEVWALPFVFLQFLPGNKNQTAGRAFKRCHFSLKSCNSVPTKYHRKQNQGDGNDGVNTNAWYLWTLLFWWFLYCFSDLKDLLQTTHCRICFSASSSSSSYIFEKGGVRGGRLRVHVVSNAKQRYRLLGRACWCGHEYVGQTSPSLPYFSRISRACSSSRLISCWRCNSRCCFRTFSFSFFCSSSLALRSSASCIEKGRTSNQTQTPFIWKLVQCTAFGIWFRTLAQFWCWKKH